MTFFDFATARRILFGNGIFSKAAGLAAAWGDRIFLVTGKTPRGSDAFLDDLKKQGVQTAQFRAMGEPTLSMVEDALDAARAFQPKAVVGLGGGSAVDLGKAVAALLPNPGPVTDYLEVIGKAMPLKNPSLPYMAVPTTSGTGAEATRNAVIKSEAHGVKVSLRDASMLPALALVDPLLTCGLPRLVTAATGMDALTQLMEAYVSARANPMADAFCAQGIPKAARSLERACFSPDDPDARADMSLASLLSGMALANAGLGAVHGIAGPMGGMCPLSHGLICARLLPHVIKANTTLLENQDPKSPFLARYKDLARWVTEEADISRLVDWVRALLEKTGLDSAPATLPPDFSLAKLVEASQKASSMKTNPVDLDARQLSGIITAAFDAGES